MRLILVLILLLSGQAFAQHSSQPTKESSADLRDGMVMFLIEDVNDEQSVWLERLPNLDFLLKKKNDDGDIYIQKVTSRDAKKLDMDFASKFLKFQYEFPPSPQGCKVTFRLTMKGEMQDLCDKADKKSQEVAPFYQQLLKRF